MNMTLVLAIIAISLALVFYTIGVFGERRAHSLNRNHVIIFWIGLIFDTIGTTTMRMIATSGMVDISPLKATIHGITGLLAIVLMLFHAIWATYVLYKGDAKKKEAFHKFSITVWAIWLIPYFVGMIIAMA
ncbi:MAG: HsmA family protein [Clostridium sp.]|uniref:HsmA family protein n=1 Tax=Clostridium sp. TaxID=1506 RepID=UPI002FCAAD00